MAVRRAMSRMRRAGDAESACCELLAISERKFDRLHDKNNVGECQLVESLGTRVIALRVGVVHRDLDIRAVRGRDDAGAAGTQVVHQFDAASAVQDVNAAVGKLGQTNPPVGFSSYSDRRDNEEEGWALQVANAVEPAPGIIFPAIVALAKDARNPAAARLVIDFLMGDDTSTGGAGFKPFYVPGDYSTRTDITAHPDAVPLSEFRAWRVNPNETAKIRSEVGDLILTVQ